MSGPDNKKWFEHEIVGWPPIDDFHHATNSGGEGHNLQEPQVIFRNGKPVAIIPEGWSGVLIPADYNGELLATNIDVESYRDTGYLKVKLRTPGKEDVITPSLGDDNTETLTELTESGFISPGNEWFMGTELPDNTELLINIRNTNLDPITPFIPESPLVAMLTNISKYIHKISNR